MYLITTTEVYRMENSRQAEEFILDLKHDPHFELLKWSCQKKVKKEKKEIVDEWVKLTVTKKFNDEAEPVEPFLKTTNKEDNDDAD